MASFVCSSTDARVRFARRAKAYGQDLVVAKHYDTIILEWPVSGIWLLYYYNCDSMDLLMTFACTDSPSRLTTTVPAFVTRDKPKLRIMYVLIPQVCRYPMTLAVQAKRFTPLDYPSPQNPIAVEALFSHLKIPDEFTAERICSVTHSFGWHHEADADHGEFHVFENSSCHS